MNRSVKNQTSAENFCKSNENQTDTIFILNVVKQCNLNVQLAGAKVMINRVSNDTIEPYVFFLEKQRTKSSVKPRLGAMQFLQVLFPHGSRMAER